MSKLNAERLLALFFFTSGFSGLLYQVVWLRFAFANFGVITPVMSAVLSVFMLGLAAGSAIGGRFIHRAVGRMRCSAITIYGITELVTGAGAQIVPSLYHLGAARLLSLGTGMDSFGYLCLSSLIILCATLPWCVAMGATFPIGMAFIHEFDPDNESGFSLLYRVNVFGALAGTLTSAFAFIELFGLSGTLLIGGGANIVVGLGAITWGVGRRRMNCQPVRINNTDTKEASEDSTFALAMLFLTGFASLAMEVLWTRAFTRVLSTTIYAFAGILATYLMGSYLGTVLYRRSTSAEKNRSIRSCLSWLPATSLFPLALTDPRLDPSPVSVLGSIVPFTLALGYLTPALLDRFALGSPDKAGRAYAVNVIGCILGPIAAGYILLPQAGVKFSLLFLAFLLALVAFMRGRSPKLLAVFAVVFTVSAFAESLEDSYSAAAPVIIRRDYAATVVSFGTGMAKNLVVNGIGITELTPITKFMAHLPLGLLQHKPRSALVICLGMGTTFRSLASWGVKTTAVELVPSVRDAFDFYFDDAAEILSRGNKIVVDDGRRFILRTKEQYDVITLDPPPPIEAAGLSLLYSADFYELAKKHLTKGGIFQQWVATDEKKIVGAVARSLVNSFPHVTAFHSINRVGYHFIASDEPIEVPSAEELVKRMPPAAQKDALEWYSGENLNEVIARMLGQRVELDQLLLPDLAVVITDEHPYNEYFVIRDFYDTWIRRN